MFICQSHLLTVFSLLCFGSLALPQCSVPIGLLNTVTNNVQGWREMWFLESQKLLVWREVVKVVFFFFIVIDLSLVSHLFNLIIQSLWKRHCDLEWRLGILRTSGWFCLWAICLLVWLRCLVVASDGPRVIKLDKAARNLGAPSLTENQERLASCESNNEIRFNSESCKPAYMGNYNLKLKHLIWKKLGKGQGRKTGLGTVMSGQKENIVQLSVLFLHGILRVGALGLFFTVVTMN